MILVDTSIWISHFQKSNPILHELLLNDQIVIHPYILGELACGNIKNRVEILLLLTSLPKVPAIDMDEFFVFIDNYHLNDKGLGFVDIHILASALISSSWLWTSDKKLSVIASQFHLSYKP